MSDNNENKFKEILEKIDAMSTLELSEFVKALEEKFGVSAAAMAVAPAGGTSSNNETDSDSPVNVVLKSAGDQKINVIKIVKEITGLGLKDAKDLVDSAPKAVKEGVKRSEAEELKKKLEEVGAVVELQ